MEETESPPPVKESESSIEESESSEPVQEPEIEEERTESSSDELTETTGSSPSEERGHGVAVEPEDEERSEQAEEESSGPLADGGELPSTGGVDERLIVVFLVLAIVAWIFLLPLLRRRLGGFPQPIWQ
ncbi:MAG: hypothetical protein ACE5KV_07360 [Thermoplasmata archaeon]